jgi:hypothetical protein
VNVIGDQNSRLILRLLRHFHQLPYKMWNDYNIRLFYSTEMRKLFMMIMKSFLEWRTGLFQIRRLLQRWY